RYQPYTGEWVLPYQVVDIQQNPQSPGKVAKVKNIYQDNGISWDNFCVKEIIIYFNDQIAKATPIKGIAH
ncbi:MAG: hypothetical protein ACRDB1_14610, partial [Microcoleaceae cyanobacterium]